MTVQEKTQIIIVGGGPVGLTLALDLGWIGASRYAADGYRNWRRAIGPEHLFRDYRPTTRPALPLRQPAMAPDRPSPELEPYR